MHACLGGHCTARGMGRGAGRKGSAPCGQTAEEAQCGEEGLCWNLGRSVAPTAAAMFTPWEGVMTCPGTRRAVVSRAGKLGHGGMVGRVSQGDGKQAEASMPVARRKKGNPQIPAVVAHDSTHPHLRKPEHEEARRGSQRPMMSSRIQSLIICLFTHQMYWEARAVLQRMHCGVKWAKSLSSRKGTCREQ